MVTMSLAMAATTLVVAWIYDLPVHDPDSTVAPTYLRLPIFLLVAFLADVLPRALWRALARQRSLLQVRSAFTAVVRERWDAATIRFALVGLAAWYLTYASFRNLKSYVPFVNPHLWDGALSQLDRLLWFGHDPAVVLHDLLGTGAAAHVLSFVYIAWIVFVPASLVVALVWSRDARAGAWYVTAVAVDWVLGVVTYFVVPTLGPVYATPALFTGLTRTDVTGLQETMMQQRHDVLVNPMTTDVLQTIAAFASLHVGICVTMCLMAELLRLPRLVRVFLWVFLAVTVVSTIYLGWHYFVDTLGGAVLGVAGVWIAARGTGNAFRRREREPQPVAIPAASRAA